MPRIRTIKPEFPQSESIGRLSRDARLLFVQLWTICDDAGRTRAASRFLASALYPYDEDAPKRIDGWLSELEQENCVIRYRIGGDTYLQVVNWLKHQKIDRPSASRLPELSNPREPSSEPRRASDADLGPGPSTKDLGPRTKEVSLAFASFWRAYPHKIGKADAEKAFKKALTKTTIEPLLEGIERYRREKPPDHSWCNPATWLNQERWTDEPAPPISQRNGHGPATGIAEGFSAALAKLERDDDCGADRAIVVPLLGRK